MSLLEEEEEEEEEEKERGGKGFSGLESFVTLRDNHCGAEALVRFGAPVVVVVAAVVVVVPMPFCLLNSSNLLSVSSISSSFAP